MENLLGTVGQQVSILFYIFFKQKFISKSQEYIKKETQMAKSNKKQKQKHSKIKKKYIRKRIQENPMGVDNYTIVSCFPVLRNQILWDKGF